MSRTTEQSISNPCKRFLTWKTKKEKVTATLPNGKTIETEEITGGYWEYWNKETETKEVVELPFEFAVLDFDCVNFKGFSSKEDTGVYSNEVKMGKFPNDKVVVRTKNGVICEFPVKEYKNNKETIEGNGAKYTKSVYIAVNNDGNYEIWNLQLSKSALTGAQEKDKVTGKTVISDRNDGWMAFEKNNSSKFMKKFVKVENFKQKTTPTSTFVIPVFELGNEIDNETGTILDTLDTELQQYLTAYFENNRKGLISVNKEEAVETEIE